MKRAVVPVLVAAVIVLALPARAPAVTEDAGVACNRAVFSRKEVRRGHELLDELRASVTERRELTDGWSYHLRADDDTVARVGEWMHLERRCCSFFDFTLEWKAAEAGPWLTIRGPAGTKEILSEAWTAAASEKREISSAPGRS